MKAYRLPALFMMLILLLPVVTAQDGAPIIIEPNPQTEVQPIGPMNQAPAPAANPVQSADAQPAPASMSAPMSEPANPNSAAMDAPFSNSAPSSSHTVETDMRAINLDSTPGFEVGEQFELEVHFRDAATADAVFSGYADFVYDDTYLQVDSITYDPDYSYLQLGTIGSGVVNDMGATSGSLTPVADTLVVTINLTVLQSGNTGINLASPSDVYAETTIYGSDNDQRANTDFASETLYLGALNELLLNGDFSNGAQNWIFNGNYNVNVVNGQVDFWRDLPGNLGARMFQNVTNNSAAVNQPLQLSVELTNTSNIDKGVYMLVINANQVNQNLECGVTVPANSGPTTVVLQGLTSSAWTNIRLTFLANNPDNQSGLLIDNVSLTVNPNVTSYDCSGLPAPTNTNLQVNGDFSQTFNQALLYWQRQGGGASLISVANNEVHFTRTITSPADYVAIIGKSMNHLPAGAPIQMNVQLGNDSPTPKRVQAVVRNFGTPEYFTCFFDIPGNTPLTTVEVRGTTTDQWGVPGVILRMRESDDTQPLRIDNYSLQYVPGLDTTTKCSSNSPVTSAGNAINSTPGIDADSAKPDVPLPDGSSSPLPEIPANPSDNPAVNPVNPNPDGGMPSVPGF